MSYTMRRSWVVPRTDRYLVRRSVAIVRVRARVVRLAVWGVYDAYQRALVILVLVARLALRTYVMDWTCVRWMYLD